MVSDCQPVQWPSWPVYTQSDSDAVLSVIKSNQLFAADQVRLFESQFSSYIGVEHAVAVGNATQGLQLALAALGIGQGDEVITPNYSFISSRYIWKKLLGNYWLSRVLSKGFKKNI